VLYENQLPGWTLKKQWHTRLFIGTKWESCPKACIRYMRYRDRLGWTSSNYTSGRAVCHDLWAISYILGSLLLDMKNADLSVYLSSSGVHSQNTELVIEDKHSYKTFNRCTQEITRNVENNYHLACRITRQNAHWVTTYSQNTSGLPKIDNFNCMRAQTINPINRIAENYCHHCTPI